MSASYDATPEEVFAIVSDQAFREQACVKTKALSYDVEPVPAVLMGIITGCVGGIIRDVLAGVPSILMRPELYVTAAALTSSLCAAGIWLGFPQGPVWAVSALAGFGLRGAALAWKIELPAYSREA